MSRKIEGDWKRIAAIGLFFTGVATAALYEYQDMQQKIVDEHNEWENELLRVEQKIWEALAVIKDDPDFTSVEIYMGYYYPGERNGVLREVIIECEPDGEWDFKLYSPQEDKGLTEALENSSDVFSDFLKYLRSSNAKLERDKYDNLAVYLLLDSHLMPGDATTIVNTAKDLGIELPDADTNAGTAISNTAVISGQSMVTSLTVYGGDKLLNLLCIGDHLQLELHDIDPETIGGNMEPLQGIYKFSPETKQVLASLCSSYGMPGAR